MEMDGATGNNHDDDDDDDGDDDVPRVTAGQ